MPSRYLPKTDHIIRYVSWGKLRKNAEETEIYGPSFAAFQLRPGETYLSATWCEFYEGDTREALRCAAETMRQSSNFKVTSKGRFAVGVVEKISEYFQKQAGRRLRFVHEPTDENEAHCAVRGWPPDDFELLERLASEIWHETLTKADIDALPCSDCYPREQ